MTIMTFRQNGPTTTLERYLPYCSSSVLSSTMASDSFAPLDLPSTIDIDVTHDAGLAAPASTGRPYSQRDREHSFYTLDNPAVHWNQQQRSSGIVWIKVLSILSLALFIDVIILTVYVYKGTEPKGYDAITHHTSGVPMVTWFPLPAPTTTITKLAFGSCSNQNQPMPYWDTLVKFKPDVVVLAGDNVYGDCMSMDCTKLTKAYQDLHDHPSFQGAQKNMAVVATLDDHDYGQSDSHGDNPHKDIAKSLFLDFFNILDERRDRANEGVYKSYLWGPKNQVVQLILLDTRYHRSAFLKSDQPGTAGKEVYMPDFVNHKKQMLSQEQWSWLEVELNEPANVRIIVSSIQVLADGHGFECWRMLPHERDRLESLLRDKSGTSAVVIVSGDRHIGGFYENEGLIEVTASSWTHSIPLGTFDDCKNAVECDETDPIRTGDMVRVNNFASIEMDWDARNLTLSLRQTDATQMYRYKHPKDGPLTDAGQVLQTQTYSIP